MDSYKHFEGYAEDLDGVCIEIGTENGQGSTAWLAEFNKDKRPFITIDPVFRGKPAHCTHVTGLAEEWLAEYKKKDICMVYMDGADYHDGERGPGIDEYSVESHLQAAIEVDRCSADRCVIVFDDTRYEGWRCIGKGAFAVPYLIGRGFEVLGHGSLDRHPDDLAAWVVLGRKKEW